MKVGLPLIKREARFTYGDYKSWPDDERWELIDGVAWNMCAAPNRNHQRIVGELFFLIKAWLRGKPYQVYMAPFDVLLPDSADQDDIDVATVVQPDLAVFCDSSKLTEAGARGAPDLVVEVLSPWTSRKDLNEKFRLYERMRVREYWVIDGDSRSLQIYLQETLAPEAAPRFGPATIFVRGGQARCQVLEGFSIDLEALFTEELGSTTR